MSAASYGEKIPLEAVRKLNEENLKSLGVADAVAASLFKNRWFTLTYQTRLVSALVAVKVPGAADYVETAAGATTEREGFFYVESAEMLERSHGRERVARILTDSRPGSSACRPAARYARSCRSIGSRGR